MLDPARVPGTVSAGSSRASRELALDGPFRMLPSELAWRPVPPPARPGDGDVGSSAACAACVAVAAVAELSFPEVGDGEPVHAAFAY